MHVISMIPIMYNVKTKCPIQPELIRHSQKKECTSNTDQYRSMQDATEQLQQCGHNILVDVSTYHYSTQRPAHYQ